MTTTDTKRSLQDELKESAHKIWLAGLGALTVAEDESRTFFRNLVEKGEAFEAEGREKAHEVKTKVDEKAHEVKAKVEETADKVKHEASGLWTKVDSRIEDALTGALNRAGVPTRDEIATLTKRVEELTRLVEKKLKTR